MWEGDASKTLPMRIGRERWRPTPANDVRRRGELAKTVEAVIRYGDRLLRRLEGVKEYSADPVCLLRISLITAERTVRLPSGAVIEKGDPIVALHYRNENMPTFPQGRADLRWACRYRTQIVHSLRLLATRFETDRALEHATAIRARMGLFNAARRDKLKSFGAGFGLETPLSDDRGAIRRAQNMMDDIWLWALIWAFNPPALNTASQFHARGELWMSRATLLQRFGAGKTSALETPEGPATAGAAGGLG